MKTKEEINSEIKELAELINDKEVPDHKKKRAIKEIAYKREMLKIIGSGISEENLKMQLDKVNKLVENRNQIMAKYGTGKAKIEIKAEIEIKKYLQQQKNLQYILA